MKKGGYQIINLGGVELTTLTSMVGLSKKLLASHLKPILLSGIVISGVKKNDLYVTAQESSGDIIISDVYGYNITIDESDDSIQVDAIPTGQPTRVALTTPIAITMYNHAEFATSGYYLYINKSALDNHYLDVVQLELKRENNVRILNVIKYDSDSVYCIDPLGVSSVDEYSVVAYYYK